MSGEENAFAELVHDYIAECLPLAEQAADCFLELEQQVRNGSSADDALSRCIGPLHTVKGNSAMMGFAPMQGVAHVLEDVVALLVRHPELRAAEPAAMLLEGGGLLSALIRSAASGLSQEPAEEFTRRVRAWLARANDGALSGGPRSLPERRKEDRRGADAGDTVRVDFRRLDALLEVLGEAMIEQAALADVYRRMLRARVQTRELEDLDRVVVALEQIMKRMEAAVMRTRLLPISSVLNRFPRLARDLAHGQQKQLRLSVAGGETLLDKTILDRLGEPLIHLLTNAIVHGIEHPAERERAGKSLEGALELRAAAGSGQVVVTLSDDGRGLDLERILTRGRELGLDPPAGDAEQIAGLIFMPGFSTADAVSSLAGRGVGLDVVARTIQSLNGTIEVSSVPGRGTTFTISLPLTLAIVRALIVEVDQERYAIPISQVAETGRVHSESIHQINQKGVTPWRGVLIHVADAGVLLGTAAGAQTRRYYVVVAAGGKRRAVLVDRLVGHQDVVVKGLDATLGSPDLVTGTTILGDGRVACILDAGRILGRHAGTLPMELSA